MDRALPSSTWRLGLLLAAVLLIGLLLGRVASPAAATDQRVVQVAGVLEYRHDLGWQLVEGNHGSINVRDVRTNGDGYITIDFDFTASKVVTFIATTDDALVRIGYSAGANCYLDRANIALAQYGRPVSADSAIVPNGNIWFYGLLER